MALQLSDLDARTRQLMAEEVRLDMEQRSLYLSDRLTPLGAAAYPGILSRAVASGDDESFAAELRRAGLLRQYEDVVRRRKVVHARVPRTAADTLAEGEFNRFYLRGLCRRVLEDGGDEVEVYRAKGVREPRPESVALIGTHVRADRLLEDLRRNVGVEPALGLPAGPNSGLSARLPRS